MIYTEIVTALQSLSDDGEIEILEENEDTLWVYDLTDGKDIVYNKNMNCQKLLDKIFISTRIPAEYRPHKQKLAEYLLKHLPHDIFWTLNKIHILWGDEEDYYDMVRLHNVEDENGYVEMLMDDDVLGKLWFEYNSVIVNVSAIVQSALEIEAEDVAMGLTGNAYNDTLEQIVLTLIHELRHLMMDTNIVLSEDEYPIQDGSEEAVEEFARNVVYENGWWVYE